MGIKNLDLNHKKNQIEDEDKYTIKFQAWIQKL